MSEYPKIEAYIWWCGDEECDCNQSVIEEVSKKRVRGLFVHPRKRLWEGTFISQPSAQEMDQLNLELKEECEKRKITID